MAHILLLEPDKLIAGRTISYFANAKHTVAAHSDPQQAISSADQKSPDIVVAELQLAGRTGVEFLYEFRSYPDWQSVPILIFTDLSAEQISDYQEAMSDLNVQECLRKSQAGLDGLLRSVERLLAYEKI